MIQYYTSFVIHLIFQQNQFRMISIENNILADKNAFSGSLFPYFIGKDLEPAGFNRQLTR